MTKLIFCENRNQFFKAENKIMSIWTNENAAAEEFSEETARDKINYLQGTIIDSKCLTVVNSDFVTYK